MRKSSLLSALALSAAALGCAPSAERRHGENTGTPVTTNPPGIMKDAPHRDCDAEEGRCDLDHKNPCFRRISGIRATVQKTAQPPNAPARAPAPIVPSTKTSATATPLKASPLKISTSSAYEA